MLVQRQEALADELAVKLPDDQEAPFRTAWVFGRRRQEALLDGFFGALKENESLVFFYTKEGHPLGDAIRRLVIGVGRLTKIGRPLEYESVGSKAVHPLWDRVIRHSIRPDGTDGLVLPYHAYLAPTGRGPSVRSG